MFIISIFNNRNFLLFNSFFCDKISTLINLLNTIIIFSFFIININVRNYVLLVSLYLIIILIFYSSFLIQIYVFFELSLIPIFLIILNEGKQFERLKAGLYMFFFTLFSSLPLLIAILSLINSLSNFNENLSRINSWIYLVMYIAFIVKLPVFFIHIWLPKAHVEAPVSGSMILAGLILKLGGYGILKILYYTIKLIKRINIFFISIFSIGSILASLYCLFQSDLKILIAVSSVRHMTLFFYCLCTLLNESFTGGLLIIICHGILSPLMFYYANVYYTRTGRRRIYFSKSYFSYHLPIIIFIIYIINFCVPPSLNFFREILISIALVSWSNLILILIYINIIVRTLYSLYVFFFSSNHTGIIFRRQSLNIREWEIFNFLTPFLFFLPLLINFSN